MNNIIKKCYELVCNLRSYKSLLAKKYLNVVFYCSNNTWCWKCYL